MPFTAEDFHYFGLTFVIWVWTFIILFVNKQQVENLLNFVYDVRGFAGYYSMSGIVP